MTSNLYGGPGGRRAGRRPRPPPRVDVLALQELTPGGARRGSTGRACARCFAVPRRSSRAPGGSGNGSSAARPRAAARRRLGAPARAGRRRRPRRRSRSRSASAWCTRSRRWAARRVAAAGARTCASCRRRAGRRRRSSPATSTRRSITALPRAVLDRGWQDAGAEVGKGLRPTWPVGRRVLGLAIDHVLVERGATPSGRVQRPRDPRAPITAPSSHGSPGPS